MMTILFVFLVLYMSLPLVLTVMGAVRELASPFVKIYRLVRRTT